MEVDASLMGLDPAVLPKEDDFSDGIWDEHVAPFMAFIAVQTQWKIAVSPMGKQVITGLDYCGVEAGLRLSGITLTESQWNDLREIERSAIIALREAD